MQIVSSEQTVSEPFSIPSGKQITLMAYGLEDGDQVIVEILGTTRSAPSSGDFCCPGPVSLPEISTVAPMRCRNGARVMMTKDHPWVVLDGPQELLMRAKVITTDITATITVDKVESASTGCMTCACEEPYCPSYPMIDGGFGFIAGDMKDPEATVVLAPCPGDTITPTIYLFPTPRPGATAAQKDCDGNLIGYASNSSNCAIAMSTAPQITVVNNVAAPSVTNTVTNNVPVPSVTNNITAVAAPPTVASIAYSGDNLVITMTDGTTRTAPPNFCP